MGNFKIFKMAEANEAQNYIHCFSCIGFNK